MAMPTEPPATEGPVVRPPCDTSPIPLKGKGFAIRAVAWVLDMIVLNVLALPGALVGMVAMCVVGLLVFVAQGAGGGIWDMQGKVPFVVDVLCGVVLATAYGTLFEWLWGRTPVKFVLCMRVVKTDGSPPGFREALIRALYRILDGFPFGGIAFMTMRRPLCQRLGGQGDRHNGGLQPAPHRPKRAAGLAVPGGNRTVPGRGGDRGPVSGAADAPHRVTGQAMRRGGVRVRSATARCRGRSTCRS